MSRMEPETARDRPKPAGAFNPSPGMVDAQSGASAYAVRSMLLPYAETRSAALKQQERLQRAQLDMCLHSTLAVPTAGVGECNRSGVASSVGSSVSRHKDAATSPPSSPMRAFPINAAAASSILAQETA